MKYAKYVIQLVLGILLAFAVMWGQGLNQAQGAADIVLIVCDGFTVSALLYLSVGFLVWVSSTDFFDIFSYAARKGAHAIVPMLYKDDVGRYYEYKLMRTERRRPFSNKSSLLIGLFFLAVSGILTAVWYILTATPS